MIIQPNPSKAKNPKTGKVVFAALAGAGAGLLAGVLLAPAKGAATRKSIKGLAGQVGDQARKTRAALRTTSNNATVDKPVPSAWDGHSLQLHGDWSSLKGRLQAEYPHLTNQDLAYVEGKGQELVNRLQARLSKSESAIIELLNAL